jgi:peptidoglycan/LPS O-acetylase OafA/YrhL
MSVGLRNRQIDLIRGVAILLVLLNHFNIAYRLDDTSLAGVFGWDAVRAVARNGNYGVTMFFVVSGYLITSNAERRWAGLANIGVRAFYTLRAARILPCLLLLLAVVNLMAVSGVKIFQNRPQGGELVSFWLANFASLTFWMNVLIGRHGWFNYPLGVLWSLSVEEVFYLSFPLLCLLLRRKARLLAFWAVVIIAGPLYRFANQGDEGSYLYAYLASFDGIAIGCCTALLAQRLALRGPAARVWQGVVAVMMAVLYLWRPIGQTNVLGVTGMAFGTAVLLLGAAGQPAGEVRRGVPPLAALGWFGRLSYELYLFHLLVLGIMRTAFPPRAVAGDVKMLLLVAFLALSAGLAALVSRFFAEPLNRRIRLLGPTGAGTPRAAT